MNPALSLAPSAQLLPATLSADGTQVIQTITQSFTQAQLTQQLASAQNNLAQLMTQVANLNAKISSIQSHLALFTPSTSGT